MKLKYCITMVRYIVFKVSFARAIAYEHSDSDGSKKQITAQGQLDDEPLQSLSVYIVLKWWCPNGVLTYLDEPEEEESELPSCSWIHSSTTAAISRLLSSNMEK